MAYFAYRAWAANNRFQETLNRNAQTRIAEATAEAAKANENVAKAEMQIANIRADTANAKKETLAVSLKLEAETIRRLDAERALLELIERVQPRRSNANQEAHVVESLKASPVRGQVRISYVSGDAEGGTFARQINDILRKAGWPARPLIQIVFASNPVGASILVPE